MADLKVEQAFELADATAERSANGCTVQLNKEPIQEYLKSNITLLSSMIDAGYDDKKTIAKRIQDMQKWLDKPTLLKADKDCEYAEVIEVNLDEIKEPIVWPVRMIQMMSGFSLQLQKQLSMRCLLDHA